MARQARPWFRKATGWWMVTIGGRQCKLVEGKQERKLAWQLYYELMLTVAESPESPDLRVSSLCDYFLDWSENNQSQRTYAGYRWFLQIFCESSGDLRVKDLKPFHVTRWIDSQKTWESSETRYNGIRSVKRVFNWAVDEQLIGKSPVAGMKLPRRRPRQTYMKDEIYRRLRREACQPLRYLLFGLRQTGARPSEIYNVTWGEVCQDRFILHEHKTIHKTGQARVIY